jgi:two-component system, NarL family, nitrate/nitrite response regulator NarL
MSDDPMPEDPMSENPMKEDPIPGDPIPGDPIQESPMFGSPARVGPDSDPERRAIPANGRIAVALIEDNRLVREALTTLLNRSPDIRVAGGDPSRHESVLRALDPDVVLLDLGLENGDSLRLVRQVLSDFPRAAVIVMDLLPAYEELSEFVVAGVSGFIMKDASLEVVVRTIRSVAAGIKVLPDQMTGTLFSEIAREAVTNGGTPDPDSVRMTPRECDVIDLVAQGMSNKAIARELHISIHTVKSHLRNIMEKLTLHSRLQLAIYAQERNSGA